MPANGRRGRAADAEGGGSSERWLLTYADLITLLLAFFVILYALANVDLKKFEDLKGSLSQAFNTGVLTGQSSSSIIPAGVIREEIRETSNNPATSNLLTKLEAQRLEQQGPFPDVISYIAQRPEGVAIAISGTVAFVSGSSELTPEGTAVLRELATTLRELPNDLRIEGHTDNIPTASLRYPTNWELSTARAVAIVRFFETNGLAPARLIAAGFGDQRPIAQNATARDRALNRRAEIVILDPTTAYVTGPAAGTGIAPPSGGRL
ncbi:MAG: OmpA family protein [Chloroflexi bacterium]|nr:OmpA family protein [Chloroflexota bacterium]